jgi:hypothetical protein
MHDDTSDAPYEAPTAEDVELCAGTMETASILNLSQTS